MGLFSSLFGSSPKPPTPSGYDWMLQQHGGPHPRPPEAEPRPELAREWAVDWRSSLTFFTRELDSRDPAHVKTSMVCLAELTCVIDLSELNEDDPAAAATRAEFARHFPLARLKQIIAAHPEYDDWFHFIRFTSFGGEFPDPHAPESPDPA